MEKRRRNTEASARSRIRRRQREEHLKETTGSLTIQNNQLHGKIREMEKEILFLRSKVLKKLEIDETLELIYEENGIIMNELKFL